MKKHLIISAVALGLVACGGDEATVTPGTERDAARQGLVYAYPAHEQLEVPTPAPIVLRFSSAVVDSNPEMFITVRDTNGDEVPYSIETGIGDGQGLVLTPDERLAPRSEYTVEIDGITLERGAAQPRTLTFTTKGLTEGPRELVMGAADENGDFADFDLLRKIPDGNTLPIMDFSSFRLQFNQPLDRTTVNYGSSVALEGPDGVVDAHLIVHGPYMTVDPKEDLTPGVEYTLSLHSDISSTYGDAFSSNSYTFTPLDSGSRSYLTQEVSEGTSVSMLTGKPVNMVPLEAVLLGDDNQTQQSGFLQAELAHIPTHPDFAPLRIKRGSMLSGTDMEVLIGGEVPAGFSSGEVKIHFISDAVGYLERNPYFEAGQAPQGTRRQLRLFMDVAITAEDPRASGAVTQDLLHLELVGLAEIRDGRLTADAISIAEPKVMGSENARSLLSFFMQSVKSDLHEGNSTFPSSLELMSIAKGGEYGLSDLGAPIILNFNNPIDPEGLDDLVSIKITRNNEVEHVDATVKVSGSAIHIYPLNALERSTEVEADVFHDVEYTLTISEYIKDIYGNHYLGDANDFSIPTLTNIAYAKSFFLNLPPGENEVQGWDMPMDVPVREQAPIILFSYPSFPCVLDPGTLDINENIAGRCISGLQQEYTSDSGGISRTLDDLMPIISVPKERPIVIHFSKEIDPDSVSLNGSFSVEAMGDGDFSESVSGHVHVSGKRMEFYPDNGWLNGEVYRYRVGSNGDSLSTPTAPICDGSQSICDYSGLPVQTRLYSSDIELSGNINQRISRGRSGGPDMYGYFRGDLKSDSVLMVMAGPSADVNANFYHEYNHDRPDIVVPGGDVGYREYYREEPGFSSTEPLVSPHPMDGAGINPPRNSSKVLSLSPGEPFMGFPILTGFNTGCGWGSLLPDFELSTCPKRKFTFLTGAIGAEITGDYDAIKGVKVNIWPGQVMATAIPVHVTLAGSSTIGMDSGPMLMRMRYGKEDDECEETVADACARTKAIEGWIRAGEFGPELHVSVDLYIDAIGLVDGIEEGGLTGMRHNLVSVPVTLDFSGPVSFSEAGVMSVDQVNSNDIIVDFELEASGTTGVFQLLIPREGTRLFYEGDPIAQ